MTRAQAQVHSEKCRKEELEKHMKDPAAKSLSPQLDSCHQAILVSLCVSMCSFTWGSPEVGGGDNLLDS